MGDAVPVASTQNVKCKKPVAKPNAGLCAIAEKQLGDLLKGDLSKASQLSKAELGKLCGTFANFPEEQRKQFSLCSAKLKAAIETAPKLCSKKPSTTKKPVGTKKPGSGGKPGGSASGLRILSDKACITLGAKGDPSICRVGPNEVDISGMSSSMARASRSSWNDLRV